MKKILYLILIALNSVSFVIGAIPEENCGRSQVHIPCPGDEYCALIDCWGKGFEDPEWLDCKNHDYNGDCKVDIVDIIECQKNLKTDGSLGSYCQSDGDCVSGECDYCAQTSSGNIGECKSTSTSSASKTVYFNANYQEEDGEPVKFYDVPSGRVMRKDGELYYIITDHLGSTTIVTDSSGNKVGEMDYYPYGSTYSSEDTVPTERKYTGQILDDSTGYYFYNARYYNPEIANFLSPDVADDGYRYAGNNPIMFSDPSGNRFVPPEPFMPWQRWARDIREQYFDSTYRQQRMASNPIFSFVEGVPLISSVGHLLNAGYHAIRGENELASGALQGAASALPIQSEHTALSAAMDITGVSGVISAPGDFIFDDVCEPTGGLNQYVIRNTKEMEGKGWSGSYVDLSEYDFSGRVYPERKVFVVDSTLSGPGRDLAELHEVGHIRRHLSGEWDRLDEWTRSVGRPELRAPLEEISNIQTRTLPVLEQLGFDPSHPLFKSELKYLNTNIRRFLDVLNRGPAPLG